MASSGLLASEELTDVDTALTNLEKWIQSGDWKSVSLSEGERSKVLEKMSFLEKAKDDLKYIYMANALFWVYFRSDGAAGKLEIMKKELDRIQTLIKRLGDIEARTNGIASKDQEKRLDDENWEETNVTASKGEGGVTFTSTSSTSNAPSKKRKYEEMVIHDEETEEDTDTSSASDNSGYTNTDSDSE